MAVGAVTILISLACLTLAGADGYQAITGKRLSKRPNIRTDAQMKQQSAIAAGVLSVLGLLGLVAGIATLLIS